MLIDKDMKKKDFQSSVGIRRDSVTRMPKGKNMRMGVLVKVCKILECNIGNSIIDFIPVEKSVVKDRPDDMVTPVIFCKSY